MALQQLSRGLTVNTPVTRPLFSAPAAARAVAPTPRPRTLSEAMIASSARNAATKKAEEEKGGMFGKGLGMLINNPVTRAAMIPLNILDYPRRAITLGVEELLEAGTGELRPEDTRSNWEKLQDPSYGVGQVLPNVTWDDRLGNFVDKGIGFAGDVALDPLTYVAGIGFATKAGLPLSKATRASMAARMIDVGIPENQVQKFVRRGASVLTPKERDLAEIGRAGVRYGTRKHNITLRGTEGLGAVTSRGLGATGDVLRRTRVGEKLALKLRTPERLVEPYQRMFHSGGPIREFTTAAERTNIEDTWRQVQGIFRGKYDRRTEPIGKAVRKLDPNQRQEVIRALEGTRKIDDIADGAVRGVVKSMSESFDLMWEEATKRGLNVARRQHYTPHILTRDAAKWMRNAGADAEDVRRQTNLIQENLYDPSGVSMARQLHPGQTLDIKGTSVTLGDASILDVNEKFRQAGLDFDFFESDPGVIMAKYINMLSSDVGAAEAILNRIGRRGSVKRLSEREMELLGRAPTKGPDYPLTNEEALSQFLESSGRAPEDFVRRFETVIDEETGLPVRQRAGRAIDQESDLELLRMKTGEALPGETFQVQRAGEGAPERVVRMRKTKEGVEEPMLTKQGRARQRRNRQAQAEGRRIEQFVEADFEWMKRPSPTRQYSEKIGKVIANRRATTHQRFVLASQRVDDALARARAGAETGYQDVIRESQQRVEDLTRHLIVELEQGDLRALRRPQVQRWLGELDQLIESATADLRRLRNQINRSGRKAELGAVHQRMEELHEQVNFLRERARTLRNDLETGAEAGSDWARQAEELRDKIYGVTERRMEEIGEYRQGLAEEAGYPALQATRAAEATELRDLLRGRGTQGYGALPEVYQRQRAVSEAERKIGELEGVKPPPSPEFERTAAERGRLAEQINSDQEIVRNSKTLDARVSQLEADAADPLRKIEGHPGWYTFRAAEGQEYTIVREGKQWFVFGAEQESYGPFRTRAQAVTAADSAGVAARQQAMARQADAAKNRILAEGETADIWNELPPAVRGEKEAVFGEIKGRGRQPRGDVWKTTVVTTEKRRQNAQKLLADLRPKAEAARAEAEAASQRIAAAQQRSQELMTQMQTPQGRTPIFGEVRGMEAEALAAEAVRERMPRAALERPFDRPIAPNINNLSKLQDLPPGQVIGLSPEERAAAVVSRDRALEQLQYAKGFTQLVRDEVARDPAVMAAEREIILQEALNPKALRTPKIHAAQVAYQEAVRAAEELHGLKQAIAAENRARIVYEDLRAGLERPDIQQWTPEQLAQMQKAYGEAITPPAVEELAQLRAKSAQYPIAARQEYERITEKSLPRAQAEQARIVTDQEYRDELRAVAREQAEAEKRGAMPISPETVATDLETMRGNQQAYLDELAKIDADQAESLRSRPQVMKDRHAASRAVKNARQRLDDMSARLDPKAERAIGEGWADDARARMGEMEQILADETLDPQVRVAVMQELDDTLRLIDEAGTNDLSSQQWRRMEDDAKRGRLGRVIELKLNEHMAFADSALVGNDVVMSKDLQQSMMRLRDAAYHKDFWPVIDTFTNLFKTYATATPGFHMRNGISAVFTNSAAGVSLPEQMEAARLFRQFRKAKDPDAWLKSLKGDKGEQVRQAFEAAFGSGIGGRYTEPGIGQRGSLGSRTLERAFDNPYLRALGTRPGANVEGIARLAPALQTIRSGGSMEEALSRVTRLHFDYSQMSQIDRNARRLIPFWTFMSRNLPLQISMMYTNPKRYAQYNSFIRNMRGPSAEGEPPYFGMLGAFPWGGTKVQGMPLYLQPDLPHTRLREDMRRYEEALSGKNIAGLLSDFNPLATAPAEFALNQNFYTGRQYGEEDIRAAGPLEFPVAALGSILGLEQTSPGGTRGYPEKFFDLFRSLNPVYDRTMRLAPSLVGGEGAEDAQQRQLESWLRFLGLPVRTLSPAQQQATYRSEQFENLDAAAMRRALLELDQAS